MLLPVLFILAIVFILLLTVGFYVATFVLHAFTKYLTTTYHIPIIALAPSDIFMALMQLDILLTLLVCSPFIVYFLYSYLRPALYEKERQWLNYLPTIYIFVLLGICAGLAMAIFLVFPYFQQFAGVVGIDNSWSLERILSFIYASILGGIVMFQIPIVVTTLVTLNIIKIDQLKKIRKLAIVLAVIIAAIITPTPDAANQLITAVPLYLLFELTIQYCQLRRCIQARKK